MKRFLFLFFFVISIFNTFAQDNRWSEEKANNWYQSFKWLNGVNYIPSDAINYTAMWDKTSFNPALIDKELALAQSIGLNCVRVVLQYAVYADDPQYFLNTLERFLGICDAHGIKVMPTFFDDCVFGTNADPVIGKQVEPLEGWYAWAWSPSPGHTMVIDQRFHPLLEKYVKDVLLKFKDDKRIFIWDLYNEPTNGGLGSRSIPLVKSVFAWAREINPVQPLTMDIWDGNKELNDIVYANSDIISFHNYGSKEFMANMIKDLRQYNRPLICTEWMNRPNKSTVEDVMPVLKKENVGGFMWGLINGKTQTHLPWGFRPEKLPYTGVWQHDLYHSDFKPYNAREIEIIKELNGVVHSCDNDCTYTVKTIKSGLVMLDGKRDESVWAQADAITSFGNPWNKAVSPPTSLRMLKDKRNLYFIFQVIDSEIVLEPHFSNERDVEKEDRVELFFSKDKAMNNYYCFEVDAKGRTLSYKANYYRQFNFEWEPPSGFLSAAQISSDGYTVEGSIPLDFINSIASGGQIYFGAYRAEFFRQGDTIVENWTTWVNPKVATPDFHVPASLGRMLLSKP